MAKPTSFKQVNKVFEKPQNMSEDECGDLPVAISHHPATPNQPEVISKWKLSPEELEQVKETGEVWLIVMGVNISPTLVAGQDPFKQGGFKPYDNDSKE